MLHISHSLVINTTTAVPNAPIQSWKDRWSRLCPVLLLFPCRVMRQDNRQTAVAASAVWRYSPHQGGSASYRCLSISGCLRFYFFTVNFNPVIFINRCQNSLVLIIICIICSLYLSLRKCRVLRICNNAGLELFFRRFKRTYYDNCFLTILRVANSAL